MFTDAMTEFDQAIAALDRCAPADWRELLAKGGPLKSIASPVDCPLKRIFGSFGEGLNKVPEPRAPFVFDSFLPEWNKFITAFTDRSPFVIYNTGQSANERRYLKGMLRRNRESGLTYEYTDTPEGATHFRTREEALAALSVVAGGILWPAKLEVKRITPVTITTVTYKLED